MDGMVKSEFTDKLGFLNRLCSGRSPLTCQYDLLMELQSHLSWEQVILLEGFQPWILPLNECVSFSVPEQFCSIGIWQWDISDQGDRKIQIQDDEWSDVWRDWCHTLSRHYQLPNGVLMMIDIVLGETRKYQVPIVILRSTGAFNKIELGTLRMVHDALQQIVDQAIVLESLMSSSKDEPEVVTTSETLSSPLDDRPEPCIQKCLKTLGLTPRQVEVMHLIIKGKELAAIAQELGCTEATVRKHVENLYRRLGVQTRTAAIAQVLETIGIV